MEWIRSWLLASLCSFVAGELFDYFWQQKHPSSPKRNYGLKYWLMTIAGVLASGAIVCFLVDKLFGWIV